MLGSCVQKTTLFDHPEEEQEQDKRRRRGVPPQEIQKGIQKGSPASFGNGLKGGVNDTFELVDVVVYGNDTDLFDAGDNPEIPDVPVNPSEAQQRDSPVVSQAMIDQAVAEKRVGNYVALLKRLDENPNTNAKRTRLSSVLTYHSTNTLTKDTTADLDDDGSLDIVGNGNWVGIARLILTPLTLGFDTVKTNSSKKFSSEIPFLVKVLGLTFGGVKIPFTLKNSQTLGPYTNGSTGLVCNVAYIPASDITGQDRIQDAGDSFIAVYKGKQNGKSTYFCGTGLTTRTRAGFEANQDEALYEDGLCEYNAMNGPLAATSVAVPRATHSLTLETVSVKKQTLNAKPTNSYSIEEIDENTGMTVTGGLAAKFQEKQANTGNANVSIPCWGALQIQVPRAAVRGIVSEGIKSTSGTAAMLGMLNINLELLVCTSVE